LRETPIAEDMVLVQEGELWRLTATLADSWQLGWWVLSQGAAIKVLAPQVLREAIMKELTQALAAYQPVPKSLPDAVE
jgi:predicted DNA-binding transcriptional regulator YafY